MKAIVPIYTIVFSLIAISVTPVPAKSEQNKIDKNQDMPTIQLASRKNDLPEKCNAGDVIKRDVFYSSGTSSPLPRRHPRYDECKYSVEIQGNRYRETYKMCWRGNVNDCEWVGSWRNFSGRGSHGSFDGPCGYSAMRGTMKGTKSTYICWYR